MPLGTIGFTWKLKEWPFIRADFFHGELRIYTNLFKLETLVSVLHCSLLPDLCQINIELTFVKRPFRKYTIQLDTFCPKVITDVLCLSCFGKSAGTASWLKTRSQRKLADVNNMVLLFTQVLHTANVRLSAVECYFMSLSIFELCLCWNIYLFIFK